MDVIGFYSKGARVVIPSAAGGVDRHRRFGGGGKSNSVELGIVPAKNAKLVTGPAHDFVKHDGVDWLVLNRGHMYEIVISHNGNEKSDIIDATNGHLTLELAKGVVVSSVGPVVDKSEGGE